MRKLTFSLFAILVFALLAACSRDPVAPDLADPALLQPAADETPRGFLALVNRLERERGLTHRQAEWLRENLKKAVQFEREGRPERADRVFEGMIEQVGKWRNQGQVTAVVADELITYLQGVLGNRFASISAGNYHTCGLRSSGTAFCWGNNSSGQLGNGTNSDANVPVKVAGGHKFASISAGSTHTCGLTSAGTAYCWGHNADGQLGNGTYSDSKVPVPVVGGHAFASISAGGTGGGGGVFGHTCGVTTAGTGYCWGGNHKGQLGNGTNASSQVPVAVAGEHTFASISADGGQTCGVTTGRGGFGAGYCWGHNVEGSLGNGTNTDSNVPVPVDGGHTFASISAGYHSCGVTTAAVGYCWGNNEFGQLGNGTKISTAGPSAVAGGHKFASISAGSYFTCGITTAGAGYCWGSDLQGSLGNGTDPSSQVPVAVAGGHTFAAISVGSQHTCGVTTAKLAYCWGFNGYGGLGDGTNSYNSDVPVAVASP